VSEPLSRSQVDKLGDRLRAGPVGEDDIRLLDGFKGSVQSHTADIARRVEEAVPTLPDLTNYARPALEAVLGEVKIVDRVGETTRDGYRALHVIAHSGYFQYEVQLRTRLQHAWAELSEKLADRFGQGLKYGEGPPDQQLFLAGLSRDIAEFEVDEVNYVIGYVSDLGGDQPESLEDLESPEMRREAILNRIADAKRFLE